MSVTFLKTFLFLVDGKKDIKESMVTEHADETAKNEKSCIVKKPRQKRKLPGESFIGAVIVVLFITIIFLITGDVNEANIIIGKIKRAAKRNDL